MPLSVGLWLSEEMERVPDVSLVRRDEWASFADLCRSGFISTPQDIFILEPNGDKHSELLSFYIGETKYPANYTVCAPGAFAQIFSVWLKLIQKIDDFDSSAAVLLCDHIQEIAKAHVPEIDVGLREMQRFIEVGVGALQTPSLFRTYQSGGSKLWWLTPVACLPEIEEFALRAKPAELSSAANIIVKRLKSILGMTTVLKFYQLSALCLGLAKRRLACADYQVAFLLTYRALDLYFQHLGLSYGVLIETAGGIGYKSKADRVHLVDAEYVLVMSQHLASDLNRRDILVQLNTVRNQMLQTHGAHHVSPTEGALAISQAIRTVSKLEGNSRWDVTAEGYFPKHSALRGCIFGMLPDISTYLEHVSLK